MVSSTRMDEGLVTDLRLSTVVPARMTPEKTVHQLTSMDLAMKLHYLRAVYFFNAEAVQGTSIFDLKKAMFPLLNVYCQAAGRIRRSEEDGGRPLIKCNDSGVRIVEARANKTLDEWLQMMDDDDICALDDRLIYNHVLGPDLGFSPLVFIQFTWFKCGGLSLGLSWAHVLGDAFSASHFINMWAQMVTGHHMPTQPLTSSNTGNKFQFPSLIPDKPLSLKRVNPVDNYWVSPNNQKMETNSLHVAAKQLNNLLSKTGVSNPFHALTAVIWKCLAKIRARSPEPKIVTICTSDSKKRENEILSNGHLIATVQASFAVADADLKELVNLILGNLLDERGMIEELMEEDSEKSDFIVYGANLTFVNLEGVAIYDVELNGQKAILAHYSMMGVGDEGVVLIHPESRNGRSESQSGQTVTMVLPNGECQKLKNELKRGWGII